MKISHREFHDAANRKRPGFSGRLPKRRPAVPERHKRKCEICNHPDREKIEAAFLRWVSSQLIVSEHNLAHRRCIYRHAHATGLYALRRLKFRCVVERIIEEVDRVSPTVDSVIRAIQFCCLINDRGEWHNPLRVVHYSRDHRKTQAVNPSRFRADPRIPARGTENPGGGRPSPADVGAWNFEEGQRAAISRNSTRFGRQYFGPRSSTKF